MTLPLRIMSRQFELITEVSQYSSLQLTRSWHGIGSLELRINRYLRGANELTRGRIIFPHNQLHKAYLIRHREIELNEEGKQSENWLIQALPIKSWLGQRITYPPAHTSSDNKQGDAETVMQHYVANNVVSPVDPKRVMPDVVLADNLQRGPSVSWQSRYKNLAEELTEIGQYSGLGWNVVPDIDRKKYVFTALEGRDLTVNQSVLPPAIFSPEFGTLGQLQYTESELNYRNHAVVGGQGEGVDRRIVEVGDSAGFDRYELFVDARDIDEATQSENADPTPRPEGDIVADLVNRGRQKLKEHDQELYMEGQVLTKSRLVYERDYDLGDLVTLQNREWGVTMDARITEVKEIYEPGGFQLEVTFGNSQPNLISKIKQELSQMTAEVRR